MSSGGRRSTTWPKGKRPPVKKPKGSKHKKTKLREAIGLKDWDGLKQYIEKEGSDKLIKEMKKLKGKHFVHAMHAMTEFFKPKLRRVDAKVAGDINLSNEEIKFE